MRMLFLVSVAIAGLAGTICTALSADVRVYVRHEVANYAEWRKVYDSFEEERKSMGVLNGAVYQSVDDPNDVTVWHEFKTVDAARAFASSPKLKATMLRAGVKIPVQVWFTIQADK